MSFLSALSNPALHASSEVRRQWLKKFTRYGVNVFRGWSQGGNKRGFVDSCPTCTLCMSDASLRTERIAKLKAFVEDAGKEPMVIVPLAGKLA